MNIAPVNYQRLMEQEIASLEGRRPRLLLHCCCAPCATQVLEKLDLPVHCDAEVSRIMDAAVHDKKASGDAVAAILAEKAGSCVEKKMTPEELSARYTAVFGKGGRR